ncbi:MAG: HlyD family efflux transporter periplasmic adaptor subunit [Myxococcales bacterium]|nr:HlyD family efflux transporter periplasmic adaptor subunit [Myxococcales bacterium]
MIQPKTRKLLSRIGTALFLGAVAALIVVASLPKPIPVDVVTVARGALEVTVDEDGTTRVKDRYVVSAPLAGTLGRPELRAGDPVSEGSVMARVEPMAPQLLDDRSRVQAEARLAAALAAQRQARASVARAEAAVELATSTGARQRQLAESGGVAAATLDQTRFEARARAEELTSARFGVRVADYEVRMAQAVLGRVPEARGRKPPDEPAEQLEIPSPIEGRVLRVLQTSEGVVQPGTPLFEVGDPGALEVVIDVLTADAVQIAPGAHVELLRWGGAPLEGRVQRIEPSAFTRVSALGVEEQRVNVVVEIVSPREQWEALGDGFRIEARIRVWREEEIVRVPASALFRSGDDWAVYVVEDELATRRVVQIGRRNGFEAQILEGLREGEAIIVHPSDQLTEGTRVRVR